AASARAPQRVAALLAAMPQAPGQWQAELAEWPGLALSAHGCARAVAQALAGLQVHAPRMRANLQAWHAQFPLPLADEAAGAGLAGHAAELARAQAARLAALQGELLEKIPSLVR
ncbi:MAG: 3-carboxy-cis,cis-muconate cycloisomerase, partial [Polaromonas sp.]|nr:3-carboxy-cis,cis-muconate cycloisomerase [Polaromonas sp.]